MSSRGPVVGSLRNRGGDPWQLGVYAGRDLTTDRKRYATRTVHGSTRDAARALALLVAATDSADSTVAQGATRSAAGKTVSIVLDARLEHAKLSVSPKTVTMTRGDIDTTIRPRLGSVVLNEHKAFDLDSFYRHLSGTGGTRGPYAPETIKRVHGIVGSALAQGVHWRWIESNPAIDASPPRAPSTVRAPPTPGQVATLFRLAQKTNPARAAFVALAASSGARRGELVALRRHDLNVAEAVLSIERGIVLADGKLVEQGTKAHQGRRISLDASTLATLQSHFAEMDARARVPGAELTADSFVFSDAADASLPWIPDSATRASRALCAKAGAKDVRLP